MTQSKTSQSRLREDETSKVTPKELPKLNRQNFDETHMFRQAAVDQNIAKKSRSQKLNPQLETPMLEFEEKLKPKVESSTKDTNA